MRMPFLSLTKKFAIGAIGYALVATVTWPVLPASDVGVWPTIGIEALSDQNAFCEAAGAVQRVTRTSIEIAAPAGSFAEHFTSNTGLDSFRRGVYHRNIGSQEYGQRPVVWGDSNALHGGAWFGDHDLSCGAPETRRPLVSAKLAQNPDGKGGPGVDFRLDEIFYLCKDHIMASMGEVDGFSITWFSPKMTFDRAAQRIVSWEVNVTDLGARQWWEVAIVPVGAGASITTLRKLEGSAAERFDPAATIIDSRMRVVTNANERTIQGSLCGPDGADPEGCSSKGVRRPFTVADNGNGTLAVKFAGKRTVTVPGRFPDQFEVYFTSHSYTPAKDGPPVGYTWHWDAIEVR